MKKIILMMMLVLGIFNTSQAQGLRFGESQYFTTSIAIDPLATIKEKSPNIVTEIEVVNYWMYVKASLQFLPDLEGGYFEYGGGAGINLTSGYFEDIRYYAGVRLGVVKRGSESYPLAGYEGGIDYNLSNSFFIGVRGTGDYREDYLYTGGEPSIKYSGFLRFGYKF